MFIASHVCCLTGRRTIESVLSNAVLSSEQVFHFPFCVANNTGNHNFARGDVGFYSRTRASAYVSESMIVFEILKVTDK